MGGDSLSRPDLFPDGSHCNDTGYKFIAKSVLNSIGSIDPKILQYVVPSGTSKLASVKTSLI